MAQRFKDILMNKNEIEKIVEEGEHFFNQN